MFRWFFARRHPPVAALINALVFACLIPGILGVATFVFVEYRGERERLSEDIVQRAQALSQNIDSQVLRTLTLAEWLANSAQFDPDKPDAFLDYAARSVHAAGLGGEVSVLWLDGARLLSRSSRPVAARQTPTVPRWRASCLMTGACAFPMS